MPPTLAQLSPTASPPCWPWLPSARAPQPLNHRRTVTVMTGPSMWPNRAQSITHQAVVITILRGRYGYCPHCTAEETRALAGGETGWRPRAASGGARGPRLIRLQSSVPGPSVHPFPHLPDKPGLLITWVTTSSSPGPRTCVLPSEQGTQLPPPHNSPRREPRAWSLSCRLASQCLHPLSLCFQLCKAFSRLSGATVVAGWGKGLWGPGWEAPAGPGQAREGSQSFHSSNCYQGLT